jgi:hypothetical protein
MFGMLVLLLSHLKRKEDSERISTLCFPQITSIDLILYIMALKGHCDKTILFNMHAAILPSSAKTDLYNNINNINNNKKEKICLLIDMVVSANRNVMQKVAERKIHTYKCLRIEIQLMWNMKFMIIPK